MAGKKGGKSRALAKPSAGQMALFGGGSEVDADSGQIRENALVAMSQSDERAILAEAQGAVAIGWVYSYEQGGKEVTGISYPGYRHMFRSSQKRLYPDFVEKPTITLDKDDPRGGVLIARCVVRVGKGKNAEIIPVEVEQSVFTQGRGGGKFPNFHARRSVMGKLIRSAMECYITDKVAAKFLSQCLKTKDRVEALSEKDTRGGKSTHADPVGTAKRNYIFSLADSAGVDVNNKMTKRKFRGLIATQFGTRLSQCSVQQLDAIAKWLRENLEKYGKGALVSAVEAAEPIPEEES